MTHLACMFHFFHTCPSFATLRHSFLGIIPHPLANCLAPNRNRRCCPLSFRSLVFSLLLCPSVFKVLPCLHFMPFFQTFSCVFLRFSRVPFLQFPHFPNGFLDFLGFPSLPFFFSSSFLFFFTIFLHFPPCSLTVSLNFPWFFPTFFLPFSGDLRRIEPRRRLETFEKERLCSFPHRHGEATGRPETRDETRRSSKTSISCETSSNCHTL